MWNKLFLPELWDLISERNKIFLLFILSSDWLIDWLDRGLRRIGNISIRKNDVIPEFLRLGGWLNITSSSKLLHATLHFVYHISRTLFPFLLHFDKDLLLPIHRMYNSMCCMIKIYSLYKRKTKCDNTSMNIFWYVQIKAWSKHVIRII